MRRDTKKDSFWLSYSDLMTSLFFVMLVLFVMGIIILVTSDDTEPGLRRQLNEAKARIEELEKANKALANQNNVIQAAYDQVVIEKEKLERLTQLTNQFKSLSSATSLRYDDKQKTFIVKEFEGKEIFEHDKAVIKHEYLGTVNKVGRDLEAILKALNKDNRDSKFLLVIEGNTANTYNKSINKNNNFSYRLSYDRALALYEQWKGFDLRKYNTEILICGSGMNGINRDNEVEENNKRFVIQILPKLSRTDK